MPGSEDEQRGRFPTCGDHSVDSPALPIRADIVSAVGNVPERTLCTRPFRAQAGPLARDSPRQSRLFFSQSPSVDQARGGSPDSDYLDPGFAPAGIANLSSTGMTTTAKGVPESSLTVGR